VTDPAARRAELAAALDAVRERISSGCRAAGRDPGGVTLVVVTKTHPVEDVAHLVALGATDVGESREQEGGAKHAALTGGPPGPRWHFIGRLQGNKARAVARWSDVVHSVDRAPLAAPLARGARESGRTVECLLQVSLDGDPARGGVPAADLERLAAEVAGQDGLRLCGIMAVAPLGADPWRAFEVLPGLLEVVRTVAPRADRISAGMSGDLEAALACGATHLRVGTAILGARPAPR
jgi:pyridoxal phosphate enzyme (YggS family)